MFFEVHQQIISLSPSYVGLSVSQGLRTLTLKSLYMHDLWPCHSNVWMESRPTSAYNFLDCAARGGQRFRFVPSSAFVPLQWQAIFAWGSCCKSWRFLWGSSVNVNPLDGNSVSPCPRKQNGQSLKMWSSGWIAPITVLALAAIWKMRFHFWNMTMLWGQYVKIVYVTLPTVQWPSLFRMLLPRI